MTARRWLPSAASLAVYILVTAAIGRDVLAQPGGGIANDPGDPLFTAAILHWNATRWPLSEAWWQFPIFHPTRDTLAFSEHLLGLSVIATPLYWITRDPLITYNLTALLTFVLSAAAMYALVWRITGSAAGAFVGGLAFGFAPYRISQLPHVQMLAAFWAPLALLGLHAYVESGRRRWLVLYGLMWMLQGASNGYSLVFFSILVALWVGWFVVARRNWRGLAWIVAATGLAVLPLAPILLEYLAVHARHGFSRTLDEIQFFSADLAAVLCAPSALSVWGWVRLECRPEGELFPGVALMAICAVAVAWFLRARAEESATALARAAFWSRRVLFVTGLLYVGVVLTIAWHGPWQVELGALRLSASSVTKPILITVTSLLGALALSIAPARGGERWSAFRFYVLAALVAWLLALGPMVTLMGEPTGWGGPFSWLMALPGVDGLRVPARFWLVAMMCLAAAAGVGIGRLLDGRRQAVVAASLAVAAVGLLADGWVDRIPMQPAPARLPEEHVLGNGTVMELPLAADDIAATYRAVTGGWRAVNGYSGYAPFYYPIVTEALRAEDAGAFQAFRRDGPLHVVVPRDETRFRELIERQPGAAVTAQTQVSIQYSLPKVPATRPVEALGQPLDIDSVHSACAGGEMRLTIDRDPATVWICGLRSGGRQLTIDLGRPRTVGALVHGLGGHVMGIPWRLAVETSIDGMDWQGAWNGPLFGEAIESAVADPRALRIVLPFQPREARYVRVSHLEREDSPWIVAELEVWSGEHSSPRAGASRRDARQWISLFSLAAR